MVVGSIKECYYQEKIDELMNKLQKKCLTKLICVKDESIPKNAGDAAVQKVKAVEGMKILEQIESRDYVVALCIDGRKTDNKAICLHRERAERKGKTCVTYIIGGSLGLSDDVIRRADEKMSFSNMTFPHQLMRVMLLEVLERC